MANFLNTNASYEDFRMLRNEEFFVDKSGIIKKISKHIDTKNRFICITKPRRFGKTSILHMLGAYYGKAYPSERLFDGLNISKYDDYGKHLNKFNIIFLSMNDLSDIGGEYSDYISQFTDGLSNDIKKAYPHLSSETFSSLPKLLEATGDKFVFIIDEWDYIFSHELYKENHYDFLEFLRKLLKDRSYVALAYMTGVLPIKQYSTGSALNMFQEYTMLKDSLLDEYFGFTQEEVEILCEKQSALTVGEISEWYNGYTTIDGKRIYNPRSVVCALEDQLCHSYWTRTGKMDEVLFFLKYNIGEVRDDVVKLVNNIPVNIWIEKEYSAGQDAPSTKNEIYAAMIIYGLLSYHEGELRIPNKELMIEFEEALKDKDFDYVGGLVRNSEAVLNATIEGRADDVVSYLHDIHNSEIPVLKYNDENSLSCVVTLAYLSARNKYRVEREEKSGKGFVDFIFHPRKNNIPSIVLELKADKSPEEALRQIKEKEYCKKLEKEGTGDIILVGINYDTVKKEHSCKIEKLSGR